MSTFGADRKMTCPACGLAYDDLRVGVTFASARREIISIGFDTKRGKTKYGRRNGTLGHMHERKMALWRLHVDECVDAHDKATPRARRDARAAVVKTKRALVAARKAATKLASRAWWSDEDPVDRTTEQGRRRPARRHERTRRVVATQGRRLRGDRRRARRLPP